MTLVTLPSLDLLLSVSFIVHSMYLKSTEHTYCDFVLRSEWSLINIPMGLGLISF